MGVTFVEVRMTRPGQLSPVESAEFLVDSGAVYSVAPRDLLLRLGITALRRDRFSMADGRSAEYDVGEATFELGDRRATSPVVFGDAPDVRLLGAVSLETLGLVLDPIRRELKGARLILAQSP